MSDFDADLGLAVRLAGQALADELGRRVAADGHDDLRAGDPLVFEHLVDGPMAIGRLADRLEITQQAVSKTIADLTRRGYVERADGEDRRRHLVTLSARGRAAVASSRTHRAAIDTEVLERSGRRAVATARRVLLDIVEGTHARSGYGSDPDGQRPPR